jgi:hypothetical protein
MVGNNQAQTYSSFGARLALAVKCFLRTLSSPETAQRIAPLLSDGPAAVPAPQPEPELPPERKHASGLYMLSLLQREGRLIDFLQEDVTSFSDADVGATARVVHAGCRKVITGCLALEPILKEAEGATIKLPAGFDAQRIRLTGNVAGQPPFRGALKHHGWVTTAVHLPSVSDALDPRVIAPAEVEL